MTTKDNGGTAFPMPPVMRHNGDLTKSSGGMTLRDWFAGQALSNKYAETETDPNKAAEWAYQIADAMLEARK